MELEWEIWKERNSPRSSFRFSDTSSLGRWCDCKATEECFPSCSTFVSLGEGSSLNSSGAENNNKVEESVWMMLTLDGERHSRKDELTLTVNTEESQVHLLTACKLATPEDKGCPFGGACAMRHIALKVSGWFWDSQFLCSEHIRIKEASWFRFAQVMNASTSKLPKKPWFLNRG